jgi:flavin-dependent dehydrogenase
MVVSYDKSIVPGYAWIFPIGNQEYNVGCGTYSGRAWKKSINLQKAFNVFITEFPLARELMKQCTHITPLKGGGLRCGFEGVLPYVNGPLLAIGETIGTTLPFTGEGTGKAMETGQFAAEIVHKALVSGDLEILKGYARWLKHEFQPRYRGYLFAEKWLANPLINDFLIARIGKSERSRRILSGIITETNDPRELFSLKGIALMFLR